MVTAAASLRALLVLLPIAGLLACKAPDGAAFDGGEDNARAYGAAIYKEGCAVCHGAAGQGVSAPALAGWPRGRDELVRLIEARMPPAAPGSCKGACAEDAAAYILTGFTAPKLRCPEVFTSPRRLRLLTRTEYRATVADLLPARPSCPPASFTFDAAGRGLRSVHVAGSFNGWAATLATGGWPMTLSGGAYRLSRALPPGRHAYKLVLDEREWIADPQNPDGEPDGFGGRNSILTVRCDGPAPDPTAAFPPESRPEGFAFDDHADARVVSAVLAEEYRQAARRLAQGAAEDLRALLGCDPGPAACTRAFLARFGLRAFRRPLSDAELLRYQALVAAQKDLQTGAQAAVQAMLQSPGFLYRAELGAPAAGGVYRLTGYEVASALSYLYWGTMPDGALFAAAAAGELDGDDAPAGIERQARRLLLDPRARAAVGRFALAWLGAEPVLSANKSEVLFAGFDGAAREALAEETRRFVAHVVFDGSGRFAELVTADYSFWGEAQGRLYGAAGLGAALARKVLPEARRAGVLAHGSVLASYAHSDQGSPIRRGLFVRRNLLCHELPPPPPDAGAVPRVDAGATTRERFRQHTGNPRCAGCHRYIDGVGFGFERFDAIGRLRDTEGGRPIDAAGDMSDLSALGDQTSAPYDGLPALGRMLAEGEGAAACFARQYYRFARGYREEPLQHLCATTGLIERLRGSGGSIQELMVQVALSPDFVHRHGEVAP